jgi:hypothetical protein
MKILTLTLSDGDVYKYARQRISNKLVGHEVVHWIICSQQKTLKNKITILINQSLKFVIKGKLIAHLRYKASMLWHHEAIHYYNKTKWEKINSYFSRAIRGGDLREIVQHPSEYITNANDGLSKIKADEYDVLLVVGSPYLHEINLLKFRNRLNLHIGYLPFYKGIKTIEWAILADDWDKVGFSIHRLTRQLDGGEVLHREAINNALKKSISEIYIDCYERGIDVLVASCVSEKDQIIKDNHNGRLFYGRDFTYKYYDILLRKVNI